MKKSPRKQTQSHCNYNEVKNDTAHQVSEEKMDKDSSDDIYEESTTYVYDGGEAYRLSNTNRR